MRVGHPRLGPIARMHARFVSQHRAFATRPKTVFASPADAEVGASLVRLARPRPGAAAPPICCGWSAVTFHEDCA
jgi:hypothetical protein